MWSVVHASPKHAAVAIQIERQDPENQIGRNALGDCKAIVIGWFIYRTSSASDTAASTITDQDAAAPATPNTAGGLKDKRNIISVVLKRIFNRKYFKVKF